MRTTVVFLRLCVGLALILGASAAQASVIRWVPESGDGLTTVGGLGILEYNDAFYSGGDTGDWTVSGGVYSGNSSQLWLLDGVNTASTTFSTPSSAVAFMMAGDWNDGLADFLVDGAVVLAGYDMAFLGRQSLIVSDLSVAAHTVAVRHLDIPGSSGAPRCAGGGCDHVAIFGAAAVPEPATLTLLGLGLAATAFFTRRRRE